MTKAGSNTADRVAKTLRRFNEWMPIIYEEFYQLTITVVGVLS